MKALARGWRDWKDQWAPLTLFQRFESSVALVLTFVIALVVVVALFRLTVSVVSGLVLGILDPLDPGVFQAIFGEILTLLIALEFNHSLQLVVTREQSIIQTKVVLLIGLLALTRKFIALDLKHVEPGLLFGLAAMALALGTVYWLMRERDDRIATDSKRSSG
jgi:uncharacterized membrane protein (DUF373 family)